jgi:hypothetical protein
VEGLNIKLRLIAVVWQPPATFAAQVVYMRMVVVWMREVLEMVGPASDRTSGALGKRPYIPYPCKSVFIRGKIRPALAGL